MSFANPSWLWAFAGLAVPIAIHLLSRKEGKVIRVGSIRHVEESNTSQFKSVKLNEIFLLFLRSLMVALLVFILSGARCTNPPGGNVKWLVVENGIEIDSLKSTDYEVHEFPKGDYRLVAEQLGKVPNEVVVISYSKAEGFNGERISLPKNVQWISAEGSPRKFAATAWQAGDSVFVRNAVSGSILTSYTTSIGVPDSIEIIKPQQISVNISADDKSEADVITAAINVLKSEYRLPIQISADDADWIFWLRQAKPKLSGDKQVVFSTPGSGPLIERISSNVLHVNRKLDQDVAINENLVIELFKTLYPHLTTPQVSKNKDARTLPDEFAWSSTIQQSLADTPSHAGIEKYLIAFFILSLATERFVAIRRNQ